MKATAVTNESNRKFLATFMAEFRDHILRVLTVLPREVQTVQTH